MDLVTQFASAHPFYYAAITFAIGVAAKHFIPKLTNQGARWLVQRAFALQRAKLKALGMSDKEVEEVLSDEADFLVNAAAQAKAETTAKGGSDAA